MAKLNGPIYSVSSLIFSTGMLQIPSFPGNNELANKIAATGGWLLDEVIKLCDCNKNDSQVSLVAVVDGLTFRSQFFSSLGSNLTFTNSSDKTKLSKPRYIILQSKVETKKTFNKTQRRESVKSRQSKHSKWYCKMTFKQTHMVK